MRRKELDLCRLVACIFVVLTHSLGEFFWDVPLESTDFIVVMFLSSFVHGAVPLFFAISGIILLNRERMSVKQSVQRAFRMIGLYFLWSTVYAAAHFVMGDVDSVDAFVTLVIRGHYHLWFLPAMAIYYFLLPIVHSAFHGKKLNLGYMLILLLVPVAYQTIKVFDSPNGKLYLLTQVFHMQNVAYVGYAIWGAWLDSRPMPKQMRWIALLVWLAASVSAGALNTRVSLNFGWAEGWLFDSFSVTSFLQCSAILCFFLSWKHEGSQETGFLSVLTNAAFGVYLIHPMLIGIVEKLGLIPQSLNTILRLTLLFGILVLTSFPLVILARKIPLIRKLM